MAIAYLREAGTHLYEQDIARHWWALSRGILLPLSNGAMCQLLFAGRTGGAVGADVRDAVLRLGIRQGREPSLAYEGELCVGDVEFHSRASDWFTHLHHRDARYNKVILHMVLILDNAGPTLREDGQVVPTCSLYDLPRNTKNLAATWPCEGVMRDLSAAQRSSLLKRAGVLRFEQKVEAFVEQLRASQSQGSFSAYDLCLIPALAEGLGYGRDRAFFRAAGQYLVGLGEGVPEPLGHTAHPPALDAQRLRMLRSLVAQWRISGAWPILREAIYTDNSSTTLQALRALFGELSSARTDILICNVVLPFAAAVALIENDGLLAERAQMLYVSYPSLSSNQVTRGMCKQLHLSAEPQSACQQQGLHYVYQQTCREKRCGQCMVVVCQT